MIVRTLIFFNKKNIRSIFLLIHGNKLNKSGKDGIALFKIILCCIVEILMTYSEFVDNYFSSINNLSSFAYLNSHVCSPLAIQCEYLIITVEKRATIMDLLHEMTYLRTFNGRCHEKKSVDDDTIQ